MHPVLKTLCPVLLLPLVAVTAGEVPSATLKHGREIAALCLKGRAAPIVVRFNGSMREAVSTEALQEVLNQTVGAAKVGKRLFERSDETRTYEALYEWSGRKLRIQVGLDPQFRIRGLYLNAVTDGALPPDPRAGYRLHTTLRLPFNGDWWVYWGGTGISDNYHVAFPDQRHAYDFVRRSGGSTHRGAGTRNDDYYAWNEPVLSPAPGRAVAVENGVPDNVPGRMPTTRIYGNHVIISVGPGEYLVICHFRQGSVRVSPGDRVTAGQVLGRCGNSGHSSEPHVHLHVQDRATLGPAAVGLPAPFARYQADGTTIESGIPRRGQTIRNIVPLAPPRSALGAGGSTRH